MLINFKLKISLNLCEQKNFKKMIILLLQYYLLIIILSYYVNHFFSLFIYYNYFESHPEILKMYLQNDDIHYYTIYVLNK